MKYQLPQQAPPPTTVQVESKVIGVIEEAPEAEERESQGNNLNEEEKDDIQDLVDQYEEEQK